MKKSIIFCFMQLCLMSAFAQSGKVISTYEYLKIGDLAKAKESIDIAITHEKSKKQAKTWFYYGNTYNAIARAENKVLREMDLDAGDKAIDGYLKALDLDSKNKYTEDINNELSVLKTLMVNQAITAYNAKGFEFALTKFSKAINIAETIGVQDTIAIFYGAVSASQAKKDTIALELYQKCVDVACCGSDVYVAMATIYRNNKDSVNLKSIVNKGRGMFPKNTALVIEQLNMQLNSKNYTEAIGSIELALGNTPDDKNLHFALGMAQDFTGNADKAITAYQKSLSIDPNYFEANFNLGALYNNSGDEFAEQANGLNYKTEAAKIKTLQEKAKAAYNKALPYLETTQVLKPNDVDVKQSLVNLYIKLGMKDKAERLK
jgi:tetratricopeptide (TPR) repeat protein